MPERIRDVLRSRFQNGDRPDGTDFNDLIDSALNKLSDGLAVDADGNLQLSRGLRLGNSSATAAGGLRFNVGKVEFYDGTNWLPLSSGGAGAFTTVGSSTAVAYAAGNVGIGTFDPATPPACVLEVALGASTDPTQQARFGNAACSNGSAAFREFAQFAHTSRASNANFALRQSPAGLTELNASAGQPVVVRQGGNTIRFPMSSNGNAIVGSDTEFVSGEGGKPTPVLQVGGLAWKSDGNGSWLSTSDARVKEDVRELEVGLAELCRVRPVRYRYNGRAGTPAGLQGVGILAQEIEQVLPETVRRMPAAAEQELSELRVFDPSALTFVLINAVKQLAAKVERLEQLARERNFDPELDAAQ